MNIFFVIIQKCSRKDISTQKLEQHKTKHNYLYMLRRSRFFFAASSTPFDPFAALGVSPSVANRENVKQKYRELAMKYHPDSGTNSNPAKMEVINRAYNMLIKEGMVDQVRRPSAAGVVGTTDFTSGGIGEDYDPSTFATEEGEDPEVIAKLDPGTERISEDGTHFIYLNTETKQWVRRKAPLTRPKQPRYGTFAHAKQDAPEWVPDLADDIRRRSLSLQVTEENRTKHQKFLRYWRMMIPFDNPVFVGISILVYIYTFWLLWHRIKDKEYLFEDKREFYFDKRVHREMVDEAFDLFEPEVTLAAEAAMLIFAAAALKTAMEDPIVPPTPSESAPKVPYYFYHLMLNCS